MSPEMAKKNEAFLTRKAAQREVRRLRQAKKKVPAELLASARASNGLSLDDPRVRRVAQTVTTRSGPVQVVKTQSRQEQAKALRIKNRRWMTVAELDEAINVRQTIGGPSDRLNALEEIGRKRCRAAWDAWKAKQPVKATA